MCAHARARQPLTTDLVRSLQELQQQTKDVKVGVQTSTAKIKDSDSSRKLFAKGSLMAARARSAATSALDIRFAGRMDLDSEAGYSLVYVCALAQGAVSSDVFAPPLS